MTDHELHSERMAAGMTPTEYTEALQEAVDPMAVFEAHQIAATQGATATYEDAEPQPAGEDTPEASAAPEETTGLQEGAVEPEPAPEAAPEATVVPQEPVRPAKKVKVPVAVDIEAVRASAPQPAGPAVVSNDTVDTVSLAAVIYKNLHARKSLSVHHVQRRLTELGYVAAYRDRDGYYADHTRGAVLAFQTDRQLTVTGQLDRPTAEALFEGDPNVRLTD